MLMPYEGVAQRGVSVGMIEYTHSFSVCGSSVNVFGMPNVVCNTAQREYSAGAHKAFPRENLWQALYGHVQMVRLHCQFAVLRKS
jgi:hypothetical protein